MLSFLQQDHKKKTIVTLQVRNYPDIHILKTLCCGERVLLSVLSRISGGLTIEAALVLPIFLFAVFLLLTPFQVMNQHRIVQSALEKTNQELSQYGYLIQFMEQTDLGVLEKSAVLSYTYANLMPYLDQKICTNISLDQSEILADGETIDLVLSYRIRILVPLLGTHSLEQVNRSRRRIWSGSTNGIGYHKNEETADQTMVYVGKGSTRYHKSRECHYLSNQLQTVSINTIDEQRNKNGGKYQACSVCGGQSAGVVFIMPSGRHYHSNSQCAAIVATVRQVPLTQVEHLGACSYCSGG